MKFEEISNAEHLKLIISVIQRETQELQATGKPISKVFVVNKSSNLKT